MDFIGKLQRRLGAVARTYKGEDSIARPIESHDADVAVELNLLVDVRHRLELKYGDEARTEFEHLIAKAEQLQQYEWAMIGDEMLAKKAEAEDRKATASSGPVAA